LIRRFVKIVARNISRMKISIGLVELIEVIGVEKCGGVVVKPRKRHLVVSLLSMKQRMMRRKRRKKTKKISLE